MPHVEMIARTLLAFRESADPPKLAKRLELGAPARQDLVCIGLMPHVPNNAVLGCVEGIVQGDRKIYNTETGGKVTSGLNIPEPPSSIHLPWNCASTSILGSV